MRRMLFVTLAAFLGWAGVMTAARAQTAGFLEQSRGANHPKDIDEWRTHEQRGGL